MIEQIIAGIEADATLSGIVGTRIFSPEPTEDQTESYIEFSEVQDERNIISEYPEYQFFLFSKRNSELVQMKEALIALLEGNTAYGFRAFMTQGAQGRKKLNNGMKWRLISFRFRRKL